MTETERKQKKKEYDKERYNRRRTEFLSKSKEYQKQHPFQSRERTRKFQASPKGHYHNLVQNSRTQKKEVRITQKEFLDWYEKTEKVCEYCGITQGEIIKAGLPLPNGYKNKRLTIDKKNPSGHYELGNIVFCCMLCNKVKFDILTYDEMKEVGKKYIKKKWKIQN